MKNVPTYKEFLNEAKTTYRGWWNPHAHNGGLETFTDDSRAYGRGTALKSAVKKYMGAKVDQMRQMDYGLTVPPHMRGKEIMSGTLRDKSTGFNSNWKIFEFEGDMLLSVGDNPVLYFIAEKDIDSNYIK